MKILLMGGTRFVGRYLVENLRSLGHEITLFTRGKHPVPSGIEHIKGDRKHKEDLSLLKGRTFDVIVDTSGRVLEDTQKIFEFTQIPSHRFIYLSSAGVYQSLNLWPLNEDSPLDSSSRHIGKAETERWLIKEKIPFTSFRPTYIYGPGNYNPIEKWFFDRITNDHPIPLPGDGSYITQLGHVFDLATAMSKSLDSDLALNKIYNCSHNQGVTLSGLVETCATACGKDPNSVVIKSFDPSQLDRMARKAFPLRLSHFLVDVSRLQIELEIKPHFDLKSGLLDSFNNDYSLKAFSASDFSMDETLFVS